MPHTETLTAAALVVWSPLSKKRAPERAHGEAGKGGWLDQKVLLDKHWPSGRKENQMRKGFRLSMWYALPSSLETNETLVTP